MARKAAPEAMPTSRTGSKRGFTLLELLVALVIMTVLCGVVMASMQPALEEARLRSSACIVIAALRYARSYAVTNQAEAAVLIDARRRGVAVVKRGQPEEWEPITTQAGRFRALPHGIDILLQRGEEAPDAQAVVVFTDLGQGEEASIVLEDERGRQQAILVDAVTGRCELAGNRR